MKTSQQILKAKSDSIDTSGVDPNLILVFGGSKVIAEHPALTTLRNTFPKAIMAGCSTSGEIGGENVYDDTLSVTYVHFDKTELRFNSVNLKDYNNSSDAGEAIVKKFDTKDLRHLFVLSDGLNVNGSQLVQGMRAVLPESVAVTGGLAGDGPDFNKTYVLTNEGTTEHNLITAIGFYNPNLKVGYGSLGGWDSFGLDRLVTKSDNNVLYEIDGQPALELYKSFLGDQAEGLPASGLLFPLSLRTAEKETPVVRTILAVDEEKQSLTFAGDIPEGAYVKLMKANVDRLINGAEGAANVSLKNGENPELAILISCVGRKLVLKQMVEEEVEAVREVVGDQAAIAGFYSYGEIAPFLQDAKCELHNQTMTITTFSE